MKEKKESRTENYKIEEKLTTIDNIKCCNVTLWRIPYDMSLYFKGLQ